MIMTPFCASHLEGIAKIPNARGLESHPSATLWDPDGHVIVCYGCILASTGRGMLWLADAPYLWKWRIGAFRHILEALNTTVGIYGLWRLEMVIDPTHAHAKDFVEYLGLTWECRLQGYGPQGQPFDQYAWVREKERVHEWGCKYRRADSRRGICHRLAGDSRLPR